MTPTRPIPPASGGEPAIRTHELTKKFSDSLAVDHVTMTIPRGSIFGFIGPSGCGKIGPPRASMKRLSQCRPPARLPVSTR